MITNEELKNAAIGAVVTVLTSFVPLSPILGGAVAGYLHGQDGPKVGAISGGIASIPFVGMGLLFVFFFGGLGLFGGLDAFAFGVFMLLFAIVVLAVAVAITVALGALGGWIGIYVLEETDVGRSPDPSPAGGDDEPTARGDQGRTATSPTVESDES
jgi:hypothetical protein